MTGNNASIILGIGGLLGHDANAALISNGQLVASAQEERFTRVKHDGSYPVNAVNYCLQEANLTKSDVTDIVFAEKPFQSHIFNLTGRPGGALIRSLGKYIPAGLGSLFIQQARKSLPEARFHYAWHHLSHVAGAYHTSPFERATFLCVDGKGEDYSATIGVADVDNIEFIYEQNYENGLGLFYTLVTHFLGFASFGSEYKVMGLAPYGVPIKRDLLHRLYESDELGGFQMNFPARFAWGHREVALQKMEEILGRGRRDPNKPLETFDFNLASSLQEIFEEEIFKMARFAREQTGRRHLLFCGGCAQNCVVAGKLRRENIFDSIFNSPVGGDMGSGMGAALLGQRQLGSLRDKVNSRGFYLGPAPGSEPEAADPYEVDIPDNTSLHEYVAQLLDDGKIIGWIRGRMELGARALGARSILADPRPLDMQDKLNLKIKFRESFRPFAPAVLAEHAHQWFDFREGDESDYMNYTADLLPHLRRAVPPDLSGIKQRLLFERCSIPSVVHVDFSARLQTVRKSVHTDFHRLITAFHNRTGIPMIINTSFNVSGQPIVTSAVEAWECFLHTDMDYLVLNGRIFRNPDEKTREEKLQWLKQFEKSA